MKSSHLTKSVIQAAACLALLAVKAAAQVDHLEFSPISSPQHQRTFSYPVQLPIPVTITARDVSNNVVPVNTEVALNQVLAGVPDYTFPFNNLTGWTRLNNSATYAITTFDVNGDGYSSPSLDMQFNAGTVYGISRQVSLQAGVPYKLSMDSALISTVQAFYGGSYFTWTLDVGSTVVASNVFGLGSLDTLTVIRLNLAGTYLPPSNGLYTVTFRIDTPYIAPALHAYADDLRIGFANITPVVVPLSSGVGSISLLCDTPMTNLVLHAVSTEGQTGDSNPFNIDPAVNLQLSTSTSDTPHAQEDFQYLIFVNNYGPATATGVQVTNVLPPGFAFVSATASQGTWTNNNGTLVCSFGSMPPVNAPNYMGAAFQITVHPLASGNYTNFATSSANEYDFDDVYAANETTAVFSVATLRRSQISAPAITGHNLQFQFSTLTNMSYSVESTTNVTVGPWVALTNFSGTGSNLAFVDTNAFSTPRFYRLHQH